MHSYVFYSSRVKNESGVKSNEDVKAVAANLYSNGKAKNDQESVEDDYVSIHSP